MISAFTEAEVAGEQGRNGRIRLVLAALALTIAGLFAFAASAQAITVTNPGPNNMILESGFLKVGDTIEESIADLDPKPSLAGSIDANGNILVPKSSFNFGTLEFPVDIDVPVIGHVSGIIGIEINPTHDVTGVLDPLTGEANLHIRLSIRAYRISGDSILNVGNNCRIGTDSNPIDLNMSTETGPIATNTPGLSEGGRRYSIADGTARFADKTFSAPGQNGCTGLAAGQINGLLGLPSASGLNAAEFDMSFDPAPISTATLTVTTKPAAATNQTNANFAFTSNVPSGLDYECKLDSGAWTPCNSKTASYSGLADGSHTFRARALAGGQDVGSTSYTWSIDTLVPVYTVSGAPTGLTNSPNANISFTVNKTMPPGATKCSLDGAPPASCSGTQNLTGLSDGTHTFTVSGTDAVGNSGSTSKTWTVDATKPVVTIDSGPVGVSSTADVEFEFTATDNMTANPVTQCQIRNDNNNSVVQAWANCSSPYQVNRPTGKWLLEVRATDNAGNVSDITTYAWEANTAEPVIVDTEFTGPGGDQGAGVPFIGNPGGTTSGDAEFEFRAATYDLDVNGDPVEVPGTSFTYECWLDGTSLGACESPMTLHDLTGGTPMAEGPPHTFEVKPTTVATPPVPGGKTTWNWIVDTVTPTASFDTQPPVHHNSSTAAFDLNIDGTGSNGTAQCKLDDGAWADCDSATDHLVYVGDGAHKLSLRAVDQAGNQSSVKVATWNTDTVDPVSNLFETPQADDPSDEAAFAFETNDNDNNVQALCQLDGGSEVPCDSRTGHTWHAVSDGVHTFTLTAKDQAGNSTSLDHTWRVDTTAPSLDINAGPAALTRLTNAAFKFDASDGGSGIDTMECRVDNGSWVTGGDCKKDNAWNFFPGPYGSADHTLQVRITDKAGNQTTKSWNWKVDLNAPDVAISTQIGDTRDTSATVEFMSSEAAATFECKLDAGDWGSCTSPAELTDLAVGNHVFSVRSVDQAGNRSNDDSLAWSVLGDDPQPETCPDGWTGTPPFCEKVPPPAEVCPDGQIGTPPNCVTPLPPKPKPDDTTGTYDPKTGKLAIRLKCPPSMKPKCIGTAVAVTGRGKKAKVMSSKVRSNSKAGKWKLVTITIKRKFRKKVEKWSTMNKKTLTVRQTVKSKKVKRKRNVFHMYKVRVKA